LKGQIGREFIPRTCIQLGDAVQNLGFNACHLMILLGVIALEFNKNAK
jgi:hypothetical protein